MIFIFFQILEMKAYNFNKCKGRVTVLSPREVFYFSFSLLIEIVILIYDTIFYNILGAKKF